MSTVYIVDRSSLTGGLYKELVLDPAQTAIVTIDMLGVKNVVLMGINTNTCVLNTSVTAFNFDYRVVVLSDCVASMYGDDLHVPGLQNVARCPGWVITNDQLFGNLGSAGISPHAAQVS